MDKLIRNYIERNVLFYLEAEEEGLWIKADKSRIWMDEMDFEYLDNCVKAIERDIKKVEIYDSRHAGVLVPLMQTKLSELRMEKLSRI